MPFRAYPNISINDVSYSFDFLNSAKIVTVLFPHLKFIIFTPSPEVKNFKPDEVFHKQLQVDELLTLNVLFILISRVPVKLTYKQCAL